MANPSATVSSFIKAWEQRDVDSIMSHFSDNPVYHNIPMKPLEGTEAVRGMIEKLIAPADEIRFEVLHSVESGSIVMNERIDSFEIKGKTVSLPVMGVFEVHDGKITAWRDYFDLAMYQDQLG